MFRRKRGVAWFVVAIMVIGLFIANQCVKEEAKKMIAEKKQTQQIIVLGDSLVEICLDLGLRKNLVAVSYLGKDIPELMGIRHLGGPQNLSEEQLAGITSDLIIASDSVELKQRIQTMISEQRVPIIFLKHDSFADILTDIKEISEAMGIDGVGERVTRDILKKIDVTRKLPENAPKVLMVYSTSAGEDQKYKSFACIDQGTFHDEILRSAGGVNAIDNSTKRWPTLSIEDLIRINPDIIIDFRPDFEGKPDDVVKMWQNTVPTTTVKAIANKQVYLISDHYALLPSTKIVKVHDEIKNILESAHKK